MAVNATMPKWGLTMKKGKISKWFKREGEPIQKGEIFFEVETEKITNKVEALGSGTVFQIVVQEGVTVPVGTVVAIIAEAGEQPQRIEGLQMGEIVELAAPSEKAAETAGPEKPKEKTFVPATPGARRLAKELGVELDLVAGTGSGGRITEKDVEKYHEEGPPTHKITPLAEEMARKEGLDITALSGTGEEGKITKEDVERALRARGRAEEEAKPAQSIPLTGMRRAIADNMHASLHRTAQLSIFTEADVTEMVRFRDLAREECQKDESVRISYNDIIIMATAKALMRHPIMNSALVDDEIILYDAVHMGVAVAIPVGLIVPVLRDAHKKDLVEIARESRQLAAKAREGTLSVDEVTGGTFTITNMSMFQVDGVTPILNPPQTGILGVGRVKEKPAIYNEQIAVRSMMWLSLTFDHRVVDGAPAAEFLETVARYLQCPALIMTR